MSKDRLPLVDVDHLGGPLQHARGDRPIGLRQAAKHRQIRDLPLERVRPVGGVEDGAGGLAPLQHVEHVLADLEQLRLLERHDRGRSRIVIEAAHDPEDHVGGRDLIHPAAAGERERSATVDMHLVLFLLSLAGAGLGGALQPTGGGPDESLQRSLGMVRVIAVSTDRHAHAATDDQKRRRSVFPLAADDISVSIDMAADGSAVPLQEFPRNAGEDRIELEFFGRHHAAAADIVCLLDGLLVDERPRGAVDHALAAGDAARLPHWIVEVEGDVGGIALAGTANDVVFLDVGA